MIWVPGGALASQDETREEIHTKERTDTDDGDCYSAEKHVEQPVPKDALILEEDG